MSRPATSTARAAPRRSQLLAELAHEQGAAVLLVTHDAEAAPLADRRYILRDGKLLQSRTALGRRDELERARLATRGG